MTQDNLVLVKESEDLAHKQSHQDEELYQLQRHIDKYGNSIEKATSLFNERKAQLECKKWEIELHSTLDSNA